VKLDRLGRYLRHLLDVVGQLAERGIGLRVTEQGIDTTTSAGRLLLHVLGAIGEFERELIVERTQVGLASAKARGRTGRRPPAMTPEKLEAAKALLATGKTGRQAADAVGVSRATPYRHLEPGAAPA
jgi:DNA invertase Pin-like site-specific DNA recombinase